MSLPPFVVTTARNTWKWQWNQLMNGLAPSDKEGGYKRPLSQYQKADAFSQEELEGRSKEELPLLIIGRSCPWAHRTWLVHQLRGLEQTINLLVATADHKKGRWSIDPPWMGCESLMSVYKFAKAPPSHRATVPALIDPGRINSKSPKMIGNESAQLINVLNKWPTKNTSNDLAPKELAGQIDNWAKLLNQSVNNGVYRCGFARNQSSYEKASNELFAALHTIEQSLQRKGPWLCGKKLTLADVMLFPTLIRWEMVYMPLFGCSKEPLWSFRKIWEWRQRFLALPLVAETCDATSWRMDYYGALFPLNPSNILPAGPDLIKMVKAKIPKFL